METFTWRSHFGQRRLHLLIPRNGKNNGMPHMAWYSYCILSRRAASFTWHLHGGKVRSHGIGLGLAFCGAALAFNNHPL